eukprot:scaffold705_cov402-Prasinococcus_capsulatus_cf.AAC.45
MRSPRPTVSRDRRLDRIDAAKKGTLPDRACHGRNALRNQGVLTCARALAIVVALSGILCVPHGDRIKAATERVGLAPVQLSVDPSVTWCERMRTV